MATDAQKLCDICEFQHIKEKANEWCSECEEAFCDKCKIQHTIGKATKNHKSVPIEVYLQLPSFLLNLKKTCDEHDDIIEFYCEDHDQLCCGRCAGSTHKECMFVDALQDGINDVKTKSFFVNTEKNVDDFHNCITEKSEKSQKAMEGFFDCIENQKKKCINKIQKFRESCDLLLEKIQQKALDDLENVCNAEKSNVRQISNKLLNKTSEILEIKSSIVDVKKYASELQAFLFIHSIDRKIQEEEAALGSILESTRFKHIELAFTPCQEIENIIDSPFGKIETYATRNCCELTRKQDVDEDDLQEHQTDQESGKYVVALFNIYFPPDEKTVCIRDCTTLPSGKILLTDKNNNRLIIVTEDGFFKKKIRLPGEPYGLVYAGKNKVAVSLLSKKIAIVDSATSKIVSNFPLDKIPRAIQCAENKLFIYITAYGFYVMNLQGKIEREIAISPETIPYFAIQKDKIYCVKPETDKISCYDMQGNLQWDLTDRMKIIGPCGITVGEHGDIFVVCSKVVGLVLIDSVEKSVTELKTFSMYNPVNVHYDSKRKRLIIVMSGRVCAYSVG